MKKQLACLLAVLFITMTLSACGGGGPLPSAPGSGTGEDAHRLRIVATTFPQYDWLRQVLGDRAAEVELTLLLDDGVDLHSYQPTIEDIATISTCDLFVHVGGESDGWVHDALATAVNRDMVVVNLLEALGDRAKEEELIEGMEDDHGHDHGEIHEEDIQDRPLSDWLGTWASIEKNLEQGDLDEYVAHQAEEQDREPEAQKAAYAQRWKSDHPTLTITEEGIDFGGVSAKYRPIGWQLVESDHGASVWYGFQAVEGAPQGVPQFVAFSDHGTGGHREDDQEEPPHFHLRYGSQDLEALAAIEGWSPTYFAADATGEAVAQAMGGHSHDHGEEALDEHVWLSLKNARLLSDRLAQELEQLDPANGPAYRANVQAYQQQLDRLDAQYQAAVGAASVKTLLFGDRFPFRYLVDDYGLSYYAAFPGCSAETEASFETIVFLAGQLNRLSLGHVIIIDNSRDDIARTIIDNTTAKDQEIVTLNSMQAVTARDVADGMTYLSVMESNLEALKQALA